MSTDRTQELNRTTGWTAKQRNHLRRLMRDGAVIAYVVTDKHGRPSNGGPATREWQVRSGLVQTVQGPLEICGPRALHGTRSPHKWFDERVWVAGFVGEVQKEEDKIGSLQREIIGEVYPETAVDPSAGVRIGCRNLKYANLKYANLAYANLEYANLACANLKYANLAYANLACANLKYANLAYVNLKCARFAYADLKYANLAYANLTYANLAYANLKGANLACANLEYANLDYANLACANLEGAAAMVAPLGWKLENGVLARA